MPSAQEKSAFSARLWFTLKRSSAPIKGATDLARLFNLKHRAGASISVQTAHKWLTGRAIPTAEKIKTFTEWLNVSEYWLHYGPPPEPDRKENKTKLVKHSPSSETLLLAQKVEALPEHQKYIVSELIMQFYGKALK